MLSILNLAKTLFFVAAGAVAVYSASADSCISATNSSQEQILMNKISIHTSNGFDCKIELANTKAAQALVTKLPLKLTLEDFGDTERIAYLKSKLEVDDGAYPPKAGDVAYYVPWGNLAFFRKDFRTSQHLLFIGKIDPTCIKALESTDSIVISK